MPVNSVITAQRAIAQGFHADFKWSGTARGGISSGAFAPGWFSMEPAGRVYPPAPLLANISVFSDAFIKVVDGGAISNNPIIGGLSLPWPLNEGQFEGGSYTGQQALLRPYLMGVDITEICPGTTGPTTNLAMVFDRVWLTRGFAQNTTATQTVNAATNSLVAYSARTQPNPLNLEPWLEVWSGAGVLSQVVTVTGTNAAGTTTTWTYNNQGQFLTGQLIPPATMSPVGAGGVNTITNLSVTPANSTAGDLGITVMRPVCTLPMEYDFRATRCRFKATDLAIRVSTNAALSVAYQVHYGNQATELQGYLTVGLTA